MGLLNCFMKCGNVLKNLRREIGESGIFRTETIDLGKEWMKGTRICQQARILRNQVV